MYFLSIFVALNTAFCFPLQSRANSFNAGAAYKSVLNSTWDLFWNGEHQAFNLNDPSCTSNFSLPAVWDIAVVAKAFIDSGDITASQKILSELYSYQGSSGWFNALPNQTEAFTDDNAQIVWALLAAYDLTKDEKHLKTAEQLVKLIQGQWSNIGGIIWQTGEAYVASISTTEAALAAVRLYKYNHDESLLDFAQQCLNWMEEKLKDPSDGFYYDGTNRNNGDVNKGKLSYTVGTAISSYTYLYSFTKNETFLNIANQRATAVFGTNTSNVLMNASGGWNNGLKYVHLLFVGIADLIEIGGQSQYTEKLIDQGKMVYEFDQLSDGVYVDFESDASLADHYTQLTGRPSGYTFNANNYCNASESSPKRSVLTQGSAAQVFYQVGRINS
ncbi:secreted protein [Candida orthopsilosis Co 90-125]|uniref:Secreted protein n=1 Tax=Candida orthopsilosis (strain 90-125) TaxID=1136231 RepID=H8X4A1_CANO9|nr:secreted protein [Candida orthopsilosis Co 90-125]CCG26053.1 secreted protein [Candida orthopsilosis Co 90-125]